MKSRGKYTILRKIADGGMAEIFLAQMHGSQGFQKRVALKRIRQSFSSDPTFRKMLVGEAHIAMSLNHSNIVQILDLGEAAGSDFLAFELVDGWSLHQLYKRALAAGQTLPRNLAIHVVIETCRALAYAHGKSEAGEPLGIIHRDVSPQNILVSEEGEVKLTDFGIAKARIRTEQTAKGIVKGKIAFMSPEQATGAALDSRSDLFSLGTVLYLLVTGKHPFQAATDLATMVRIQACEFVAPGKAKPKLEPELAKLLAKVMARRPSDRFQTAQELLEAAEKVMRQAFQPFGQTELKRWLDQLSKADGALPISRAQGAEPPLDPQVLDPLELNDSDIQAVEGPSTRVDRPRKSTVPPPLPRGPRSGGRRTARWTLVGVSLLALVAVALFLRPTKDAARTSQPRDAGALQVGSAAVASKSVATGLDADAGARRVLEADAGANVDSSPQVPVSSSQAVASPQPETATALDAGESLEDAGVATSSPAPSAPSPESSPAVKNPPAVPPSEMVSVRVDSQPPGAAVKLGLRTFGKTPIHLRFRKGLTVDLVFTLEGFLGQTKRFHVENRSGQTVTVALRRVRGPLRRNR